VEVVGDVRDPLAEVGLEEILQLAREFDARRAAADDHHVQQPLHLFRRLVFEGCGFAAVHDALANGLSIADFLEEEAVFANARNAKRRVFGTHAHDQHIKRNLGAAYIAFDLRIVIDIHNLFLIVDLGCLGFVVVHRRLLVSEKVADRLHDGSMLNCAGGTGRK